MLHFFINATFKLPAITVPKTILRQQLELIFTEKDLTAWFDPLSIYADEKSGMLRICFPHSLFARWFFEKISGPFEICVKKNFPKLAVTYDFQKYRGNHDKDKSLEFEKKQTENLNSSQRPPLCYSFSNFLVNKKNDFPVAAARKSVDSAKTPPYNIFVVYGNSGSGKTHLLGAMANAIIEKIPSINLLYGDVSVFEPMNGKDNLPDVFIIDNAQEICRDSIIQEKLTYVLDRVGVEKKMAVFSFEKQPTSLPNISKKLMQRLSSGLILELKKPDIDIRRRYVHQKNEDIGTGINKAQELTIAQMYHDFRAIDGVLSRIKAYKENVRQDADLGEILVKDATAAILTPSDIIKETARFFSIPESSITGKNRDRKSAEARKYAIFLARDLLGISLVQLGLEFGGRDHSSIIYAIKNIKKMQISDKVTNKNLTELKQLCISKNA